MRYLSYTLFLCGLLVVGLCASSVQPAVADDLPTAKKVSTRGTIRTVAMQWLNSSGQRKATQFGITLDVAKPAAEINAKPLVILIHGYNSSPERNAALLEPARRAGFRTGVFRYPNDQAIADSAELLSAELTQLGKTHPGRQVTLITYSMGGLVAREAIENSALDPGNVSQLLMVAPPSHGSSCARIACSGDIWEHGTNTNHGTLDCIYACLEDGCGEARHDLKPGSDFLTTLNFRPRNPRVSYSIFLGTGGKLSAKQLAEVRAAIDRSAQQNSVVKWLQPAIEQTIEDLNDAATEGDGVVSLARGRLDGVHDTVELGFNHWNVIDKTDHAAVKKLHAEILSRLNQHGSSAQTADAKTIQAAQ